MKAIDRIVELCGRDPGFLWLTKGQKPQRDTFYDFIKHKLTAQILEDLHYQFMRRLQKEGLITLESLFIDGTKIEANAGRYTFECNAVPKGRRQVRMDAVRMDAVRKKSG